ncbi:MAG: hypothetical protein CVV44_05700 [Spirochaetae bacterium HGW-Spirochaetae-1]|jgi:hypothetical protein|nr:MAG: hypothetical protein CVV44_05700 [Spirochaetae bacterium HGW-Spirochaetae-1]
MKISELAYLVDPVREMIDQYSMILNRFREETGAFLACSPVDALPVEIAASFNLYIGTPPVHAGARGACRSRVLESSIPGCYDALLVPRNTGLEEHGIAAIPVIPFTFPGGFGEEAGVAIHSVMDDILQKTVGACIKDLDVDKLQAVAGEYDNLRRIMRSIAAKRREVPRILSNRDLLVLFEAAVIFPPSVILGHLSAVRDACNAYGEGHDPAMTPVMVYAGPINDGALLDDMEESGFLVAEDDHCNGRRQFDISVNPLSDYIYYEILDAYTYKPLCPSLRIKEERFELLYKLLRNYAVETVVFLEDLCCPFRKIEMEYLRVRLMRIGVDPVIASSKTVLDALERYKTLL